MLNFYPLFKSHRSHPIFNGNYGKSITYFNGNESSVVMLSFLLNKGCQWVLLTDVWRHNSQTWLILSVSHSICSENFF